MRARKDKVVPAWVAPLGGLVRTRLTEKTGKSFTFRQAGPYAGSTSVGVVFHEPEFSRVPRVVMTDKADFRFGFATWATRSTHDGNLSFVAGFETWNKVLARAAFLPNIRANSAIVAAGLGPWLSAGGWVAFDKEGGGRFESRTAGPSYLRDELLRYGDLDRKSTGVHSERLAGHVGSQFRAYREVAGFSDFPEDELAGNIGSLSDALLDRFEEIAFLYGLLRLPLDPFEGEVFDPAALEAVRERIETTVADRVGQSAFRDDVFRAYGGRCAVSGCAVGHVLQAAHIVGHTGPKSNHVANGILLRADIHHLFDKHLIGIDPATMTVRVAPELRGSEYECYDGLAPAWPTGASGTPSRTALAARFALFLAAFDARDGEQRGVGEKPQVPDDGARGVHQRTGN